MPRTPVKKPVKDATHDPMDDNEWNDPDDPSVDGPMRSVEEIAAAFDRSEEWVRKHASALSGVKSGGKWQFRLYKAKAGFRELSKD